MLDGQALEFSVDILGLSLCATFNPLFISLLGGISELASLQ